jgi:hypothetical protein
LPRGKRCTLRHRQIGSPHSTKLLAECHSYQLIAGADGSISNAGPAGVVRFKDGNLGLPLATQRVTKKITSATGRWIEPGKSS